MNIISKLVGKVSFEESEKKRQVRQRVFCPKQGETQKAQLRGIRLLCERYANEGDCKTSSALNKIGDEAQTHLEAHDSISAEIEEANGQPSAVSQAAADAAKHLLKILPNAFRDAGEATEWVVKNLPLSDARAADRNARHAMTKMQSQKHSAKTLFDAAISNAVALIFGASDAEGAQKLARAGGLLGK